MSTNKPKKRVIVGMSAGVDSSVAAALLKEQGYDVVGVFLHFWKEPGQNSLIENKCCSIESQQDARKIAQILDIPLYTVNAAKEFKREIVDYFLEEIGAGRTPNPCVVCNEKIKFNFLFKKMLEMDADFVATGHYARIEKRDDKLHLYMPSDKEKDQTYFLHTLGEKQLERILFPLGEFKKPDVRKMAEKLKLPVFDKEDSQGLCFTSEKTPNEFLKRNLKLSAGDIFTTEGKKIGMHAGLELYTIGQRKGVNIGGDGPYFVVERDFVKNILIVTNNIENEKIFKKNMSVQIKNWLGVEIVTPLELNIKIRYRHNAVRGIIKSSKKNEKGVLIEIDFIDPQKAVTPGQSAVFYSDDEELLGGGVII